MAIHSSIKGKLDLDTMRPMAKSLVDETDRDFDL